jgi:putative oxidoreductase
MKRLFSTKYSENGLSFALLIFRITLGGLVIPHGYDKLMSFASKSSTFNNPYHLGHSTSMALVIFAEFFCGALITMGLFTRLACIPLIISMATAETYVHHWRIFSDGEHAALFLGCFITLLFTGPGKASLDRLIGK